MGHLAIWHWLIVLIVLLLLFGMPAILVVLRHLEKR